MEGMAVEMKPDNNGGYDPDSVKNGMKDKAVSDEY